jgi:hypothetical protein
MEIMNMKKHLIVSVIVIILLIVGFNGCTENQIQTKQVKEPLENIILKQSDISTIWNTPEIRYIDEPYEDNDTKSPLYGETVQEIYEAKYSGTSIYDLLEIVLVKAIDEKKCQTIYDLYVKNCKTNFTEIDFKDMIGDNSYVGKMTSSISGRETNSYVVCFYRANILVSIMGQNVYSEMIINYAEKLEKNIENALE